MDVSRAAFFRAARRGNVATVRAYLQQAATRAAIDATEAVLRSSLRFSLLWSVDHTLRYRLQQLCAWFHRGPRGHDVLVFLAGDADAQLAMIEWLFGRAAQAALSPTTLPTTFTYLFLMALLHVCRDNNASAIESMVTSHVFCHVFRERQRRRLLCEAVRCVGLCAPESLQVLLAHGADISVHDTMPFLAVDHSVTVDLLRLHVANGACLVGSSFVVLNHTTPFDSVRELIRLGAHANGRFGFSTQVSLATDRTARLELLRILLEDGFVDVDRVSLTGRTQLMSEVTLHDTAPIVELLLRYGADPLRQDLRGNTAMQLAALGSPTIRALLRASLRESTDQ